MACTVAFGTYNFVSLWIFLVGWLSLHCGLGGVHLIDYFQLDSPSETIVGFHYIVDLGM